MNNIKGITFISILVYLVILCSLRVESQNLYFSQFENIPLFVNPANTGLMNSGYGNFRFVLNYKNQWASVGVPYVTAAFSGDAEIVITKKEKDRIGAGLIVLHDQSGTGNLGVFRILLSTAYHKTISEDGFIHIAVGMHGGYLQKRIDIKNLAFPDQFNGLYFDPSLPTQDNLVNIRIDDLDLGVGFIIYQAHGVGDKKKIKINKNIFKPEWKIGYQIDHVNLPRNGFLSNSVRFAARHIVHGEGRLSLAKSPFNLRPRFLFLHQNTYQEFTFGVDLEYFLLDSYGNKSAIYFGSRYRFSNAAIAYIGIEHKGVKLGISYDINTSRLVEVSKGRGGLELSLTYVSDHKLKLICPKF